MVLERVFGVAVALEDVVVETRSERRVESGFWLMKECWKDVNGLKGCFRGQRTMVMLQGRPEGTILG